MTAYLLKDEEWNDDDPLGDGDEVGEFDYLSCAYV